MFLLMIGFPFWCSQMRPSNRANAGGVFESGKSGYIDRRLSADEDQFEIVVARAGGIRDQLASPSMVFISSTLSLFAAVPVFLFIFGLFRAVFVLYIIMAISMPMPMLTAGCIVLSRYYYEA